MMREDDRRMCAEFAARVRDRFPEARIWAFGSRARGTAAAEADLDLCVVIDQWSETARIEISRIAWEVGWEQGVVISTVVFSAEEFERGPCSESPLVCVIRNEGIAA